MKFTNAATLHRKSGGAQWGGPAVSFLPESRKTSGIWPTQGQILQDGDLTFRRPGEGMHRVAILIQVAQSHLPGGYRDMAETVHLLRIRPALRRINLSEYKSAPPPPERKWLVGCPSNSRCCKSWSWPAI